MSIGQGGGLNFTATLNIDEAKRKAEELKKLISQLTVTANGVSKGDDAALKPLTEYQKKQLEIKQQVVDLAKAKQDSDRADKAAALDRMQALRDERLAREQINTQIAAGRLAAQQAAQNPVKRVTDISNSQAEIDAYAKGQKGSLLYTSAINAERVARAQLNAENAKAAISTNSLSLAGSSYVNATKNQTSATNANVLTKKQLAQALAEEKYRQQQSTAELKNNAREMLNAKGSLEQRRAALIRLTTEYDRLSKAERETSFGIRLGNTVKSLSVQVGELEAKTNRFGRNVGNYANAAVAFFTSVKDSILSGLGPIALLTAAISAAKAAISHNVELSDDFVDVQRTAKLSADQVDSLGEKLKKLNTRTGLEGLLDIGFIGGRLGVAKDDLLGFIQEVDELSVVLKKEFPGGADAVVTALGKIISVYKITQKEGLSMQEALKKVGSSILEVSHNGGATVQYLQEFSLKTASIAQIAKISLPTILGYGAVLSKAGVQASTAATGVTRLISDLSTKRDKYFAIAQLADSTLTLEKFTKLINTDTNSALEAFFKGLKAGNPTQTETADRLQTLHLTAGRVKSTVISLSEAQEQLAEKTAIANKGYEDGTSVAHNFELANNSLGAVIDKIGNKFANAFANSGASRALADILSNLLENKTAADHLSDAYGISKQKFDDLNNSLKPLLSRYDQLKRFTVLNKDEQAELRDVTAQLGDLLPGIVNKFDNYGNAIDINRGKVQELTKAQRDLLELQNRSALKGANEQFDQAQKYLPQVKAAAERAAKLQQNAIDRFFDSFSGGDSDAEAKQKAKDRVTQLSGQAYAAAKAIRALGGELTKAQKAVLDYYEAVNKPKPGTKQQATIVGDGTEDTDNTDTARTVDSIKADIKRVTELMKPLDVASAQYKTYLDQLKAFKKELKLANGGKDTEAITAENQYKAALKSRNDLQKDIDALTKRGTDKQLSADEQEVESVKDKYAKMKEAAIAFNNDPVNKKKGLRVDAGGLVRAQDNELRAVADKQDTAKLKVTLDEQKKLYDDFEAYKTKVGEDEAKKRYAGLIDTDKTYLQSLEAKRNALINGDDKAKGGADVDTGATQLQLKLVEKEIADEKVLVQKKNDELYADAYQSALTTSQALLGIEADYQRKVAALGKDATKEQIDNLKLQRDERRRNLNAQNADEKAGYDKLLENIDAMTRGKAIDSLEEAKAIYTKQYKAKLITAQFYSDRIAEINAKEDQISGDNVFNGISRSIQRYKQAKDAFDKATDKSKNGAASVAVEKARAEVYNKIASGAEAASRGLSGLGDIFDQLSIGGQGLQDALKGISGVLSGAGELAKGLKDKDPVSIVTGAVNILTSAISLFSHKDKDLQKKIDGYQRELNALGQAYKQLDRDVANAAGNDIYADQEAQIENLQAQQAKLTQMRDAEASKKKKDQSKIDDYNNQIADIPNQIADINQAISANLIQGTFRDLSNSLSDALTSAFQAGEDGIAAMDKSFDEFIGNAIKNSLKLAIFDKDVKEFTDELTAFAKANGNSIEKFDFSTWKAKFDQDAAAYNAGLAASSQYFPSTKPGDDTSTARGQVAAALTEDTATRVYGVLAGTQVGVLQVRDEIKALAASYANCFLQGRDQLTQLVQIAANTKRGADNTDGIATTLKNIENNTKGTSMRGAGLG
ncbi:phage tail tape measure protein [Mucilaginibacter sabulilitoris]|uniref:Phage tail tape measure protein n=1 Tax=Mucilaginibacter sabulilitoris TaxID=1173583 RepID=A0ABZ0TJA6_9SPHI|nr:phage tail tape measure protein [Mucilaginibacter sabulilitoris]WPU91789.1 phage tail tape measure protein [Mucilaginibacter sabulilitoris]